MTGSLQLNRGKWYIVICYKDEANQKKQKWISTGLAERGNKRAAKEMLDIELAKFEKELEDSKNKITDRRKPKEVDKNIALMPFSDYCAGYVESIKSTLTLSVYKEYSESYPKRIREYFDRRKLRLIDVTEEDIEGYYQYLKGQGLKNTTIKHYDSVLRPALRKAYQDGLIPDNPYEFISPLKKQKVKTDFYDKAEMSKLFEVIQGHKLELAFKMAAFYGFRRSELAGLRWSAIDFEHKTITVNHRFLVVGHEHDFSDILKTKTSLRTLPLIPQIEKMLLEHREVTEENRAFYGNAYDVRYNDYVFVNENGRIVHPNYISKLFADILKKNGLKYIRFHDLRHSCASIMLANGVQMKQIQEWLGHSNYSTTADVYSHLDYSSKVQSASVIADALSDTKEQPKGKEVMERIKKLGYKSMEEFVAKHLMSDEDKERESAEKISADNEMQKTM